MGRKNAPASQALRHRLYTRVNDHKYRELQAIVAKNPRLDMSTLLRNILHDRTIKVYTHDQSLDLLMEELSRLRAEIRAIGVNINQQTRYFNTYKEARKKELFARIAFKEYQAIEPKIDSIYAIIAQLSKKWLQE